MIKQLKSIAPFVLSLCITISCSTQDHSPADQLIEGPIDITTEWQTIFFDKPLQAAPFIQYLELLFCNNQIEFVNLRPDEVSTPENTGNFKRTLDNKELNLEVFIYDGKKEYALEQTSSGSYYKGKVKGCLLIGFGMEREGTEAYIPKELQFFSTKIRANLPVTIDSIYWIAPDYERNPNKRWDNVHPSKIIDMKSQALPPND